MVAVITGHGLKDPDAITTRATAPLVIGPVFDELMKVATLDS